MSRPTSRRHDAQSGALPDRRRFLHLLGAVSAAPWAGAVLPALGQAPQPTPPQPASPPPAPTPAPAPAGEKPKISEDARSLLEIVRRRFGKNLDAAQLESIAGDLQDGIDAGATLRKVQLRNSDEPDVVFRAEPPEV